MLETHVSFTGHSRIDFDEKQVRKAMRQLGADVRKTAQRLVARKAISHAGEFPGKQSGALQRSIKARVSRPGFLVRIAPTKTSEMQDFYPAFLGYGVRGRFAPRKNYMTEAQDKRSDHVRQVLKQTLIDALVPRK